MLVSVLNCDGSGSDLFGNLSVLLGNHRFDRPSIESASPLGDGDRRDTIPDEVYNRPRLVHEAVDAE